MEEEKLYRTVPLVAMRGSVVFPNTESFLSFGRPKSISAVNSAFQTDRIIAIFNQRDPRIVEPLTHDLYTVGTIAVISQMMSTEQEIHAMVKGQARVRLKDIMAQEPYLIGNVIEIPEVREEGDEIIAMTHKLEELFRKAVNLGKTVDVPTVMKIVSNQVEPYELVDSIASVLEIKPKEKQKLLETLSLSERLKKVTEYLAHEMNVLDLERSISAKTQKRFEDQMRKAMLREKKRTIEEELGEISSDDGEQNDELAEYKAKIKKAKMPEEVEKKSLKELKRLTQMSPHNPEGGYIRNYLDWLVDMPWSKISKSVVSVKKAGKILDEDHFGLGKAKDRILEFLSVMKLKQEQEKESQSHPTILCFVGPPGVGKTSIGRSIARAMNRKFVRVSLGGIRDEAEMRGHRRTYVGALPGRIIQSIKNAETRNPVFMLDEIDKLGADFRGDPSSALLEILDPEQNKEFSDHYLEVPFDLSDVMFICTANVLESIPGPLRDRMEIIKFAGYIEEEKFQIAKKYLWPKQVKTHGLDKRGIKISDKAIRVVIKRYTREAGVRDLERNLATLCRKVAHSITQKGTFPKLIDLSEVAKFLGPAKFSSQIAEKDNEIGMSTGLAVTAVGGEILFIEVALMPGKGKLTLTGKLGEVMKESAKAAFTWTKAHWDLLGLPEDFAQTIDVHVHVPEGATPKDGPSAGVAMTTALVSALTKTAVHKDVGMTGEVTLRGRVLEIGGVKEKVVAGHRAGLKTIILPHENKKDMEDIPEYVQKDIKFVFAEKVEEVLKVALTKWPIVETKKTKVREVPQAFIAAA